MTRPARAGDGTTPGPVAGAARTGQAASAPRRLATIEALRGVAALAVFLYHCHALLGLPVPGWLAFVPTHAGLGVPLFYTLSGFVLATGYAGRLESRAQVLDFYIRRFFRIAPLFYLMTLAWLLVRLQVWHAPVTSQALFLNASFLFGLVPGAHGSLVWAGWSIGVEMLFYLLFPLVMLLVGGARLALAAYLVACVLSAAVEVAFINLGASEYGYMNVVTQLPFFIAGIAGFHAHRLAAAWPAWTRSMAVTAALALMVLLVSSGATYTWLLNLHFGSLQRNIWALAFALLIFGACAQDPRTPVYRLLRPLGEMSFSLYLVHPLCMLALMSNGYAGWVQRHLSSAGQQFVLGGGLALAGVLAVCLGTYHLVERPGMALGKRLTTVRKGARA